MSSMVVTTCATTSPPRCADLGGRAGQLVGLARPSRRSACTVPVSCSIELAVCCRLLAVCSVRCAQVLLPVAISALAVLMLSVLRAPAPISAAQRLLHPASARSSVARLVAAVDADGLRQVAVGDGLRQPRRHADRPVIEREFSSVSGTTTSQHASADEDDQHGRPRPGRTRRAVARPRRRRCVDRRPAARPPATLPWRGSIRRRAAVVVAAVLRLREHRRARWRSVSRSGSSRAQRGCPRPLRSSAWTSSASVPACPAGSRSPITGGRLVVDDHLLLDAGAPAPGGGALRHGRSRPSSRHESSFRPYAPAAAGRRRRRARTWRARSRWRRACGCGS